MNQNTRRGGFSIAGLMTYLPTIVTVGVAGAVVLIGLSLYKKFFSDSPVQSAQNAADTTGASDLTTSQAASAVTLATLSATLAAQGLTVNVDHQSYANTLNTMMDNAWVDHGEVMSIVQGMGLETFQLTAVAYQQRELRNYRNSIAHIFEPSVWTDMFSDKKLYGTLRFHLYTVLTLDEYKQLGAYVNTVP